MIRNVFDQYTNRENRLSHGLAVCLLEDTPLLHAFLKWLGIERPTSAPKLMIAEQSLPGDIPQIDDEDEAERRGLPDIVIHNDADWCVFIESKVKANLTADQLERQKFTLQRRGFARIKCVVLTRADVIAPRDAVALTWSALYEWLGRRSNRRDGPKGCARSFALPKPVWLTKST